MPKQVLTAKYFDRGCYPVFVGVVFTLEELRQEFKRLHISEEDITANDNTDAQTLTLESPNGGRICLVYINIKACKERPFLSEVMGICAHEATHVWQSVKEYIGERRPGEEQEAYFIQHVSQNLFTTTLEKLRIKDNMTKVWDKKSTKKKKGK